MSEGKSEGKKAPPLGVGGRTKSWVETTEFPVAPTEQPRAGVILFHEPSKEGDDDESCSDHTDADTDALLMTASSQRDLMEELQRVQASEEVYHDAGTRGSRREEHAGVRGAEAAAAAAAGLSEREGGRLCGEVCGGRGQSTMPLLPLTRACAPFTLRSATDVGRVLPGGANKACRRRAKQGAVFDRACRLVRLGSGEESAVL